MPATPIPGLPDHPAALDDYLQWTESSVPGIRKDCEKTIVWHDGRRMRRDLAVVYLHGFSASRMETWPLCDRLAASIGANLFYTRLTGHGRDGPAMAEATLKDWQADGCEAVAVGRRLGRRIILVGTSTGATLATWLAAQPAVASALHSLVLLSPNFMPRNPLAAAALWPPSLRLMETLFGGWRAFELQNDVQARYWTVRYPISAVATMMQLVHLAWRTALGSVAVPVLTMLNPKDRIINVRLASARVRGFPDSRNQLVFFACNRDLGRHVLAGDVLSPGSVEAALTVIRRFLVARTDARFVRPSAVR